MIDMSLMKKVTVNAPKKTVTAQGPCSRCPHSKYHTGSQAPINLYAY